MRVFGIFSSDQVKQRLVLDFITDDELAASGGGFSKLMTSSRTTSNA